MKDPSETAIDYIIECCPSVGGFAGTSDVGEYLKQVAFEMKESQISKAFPARYKEHVAYAVNMVASFPLAPEPATIASVFLVTRFEYYFRILSGKLNADGTWISQEAQASALAGQENSRLKKNLEGERITNVSLAYKIMKIDQSRPLAQHCARIDNILYSTPQIVYGSKKEGVKICDIGDRIAFIRHHTGHGYWGDISAEARFYGLLTALVFYNQSKQ